MTTHDSIISIFRILKQKKRSHQKRKVNAVVVISTVPKWNAQYARKHLIVIENVKQATGHFTKELAKNQRHRTRTRESREILPQPQDHRKSRPSLVRQPPNIGKRQTAVHYQTSWSMNPILMTWRAIKTACHIFIASWALKIKSLLETQHQKDCQLSWCVFDVVSSRVII